MKLNKLALVFGLGMAVAVGSASADQGTGDVTFVGKIIDAPCTIKNIHIGVNGNQEGIPMGAISSVLLSAGGSSTPRDFQIDLENCSLTTASSVSTTFSGVESPIKSGALAINGTAKNAAIVITDRGGNQIKLGTKTPEQTLTGQNNSLKFSAYLQGDAANPAVAGDFKAIATFALSYQ